jgi:hypothetical protein
MASLIHLVYFRMIIVNLINFSSFVRCLHFAGNRLMTQCLEEHYYNNSSTTTSDIANNLKYSSIAQLVSARKPKSIRYNDRPIKHTMLYLSLIIIMMSSDVELNPGPRQPKYPCQICHKAVTWKTRGVACDDCSKWYHTDCMHMS